MALDLLRVLGLPRQYLLEYFQRAGKETSAALWEEFNKVSRKEVRKRGDTNGTREPKGECHRFCKCYYTARTNGRTLMSKGIWPLPPNSISTTNREPPMDTEDFTSHDEMTDLEGFMSYHTLSTMIDYAYEEDIDWKAMEVSDSDDEDARAAKLDLLLDLHRKADCWLIPALKSEVKDKILVAGKAFVNLSNVMDVKEGVEEDINWKAIEVSDDDDDTIAANLDLLLDLHREADCWLIAALKSEVEDKFSLAARRS